MSYQNRPASGPITNWMPGAYNLRPIPISCQSLSMMATDSAFCPSNISRGNFLSLGVSKELLLVDAFALGWAGGHRLRIDWIEKDQTKSLLGAPGLQLKPGLLQ